MDPRHTNMSMAEIKIANQARYGCGLSRRAIQRRMRREFNHRRQIAEIRLNPPKETPDPVILEEAPPLPESKTPAKKRKTLVLKKRPAAKKKPVSVDANPNGGKLKSKKKVILINAKKKASLKKK